MQLPVEPLNISSRATSRIPSSPPSVQPIPEIHNRPRWSVMIPVYNNLDTLGQTIRSVLQQNMSADLMQIEIIDDASTDGDVQSFVHTLGGERITYFRQPENQGSVLNFLTCINRARGEWVHILHGDDYVQAGYYEEMEALFSQFPEAGAAFCRFEYVNEKNERIKLQSPEADQRIILDNWLAKIASFNRVQFAAITIKRKVYEELGGFFGVNYGEDWEMWARIAAVYPVAYSPRILASYRKHELSITGSKVLSGDYIDDLKWVMTQVNQYLPHSQRRQVKAYARQYYAKYALNTASQLWHDQQNRKAALVSVRKAVALNPQLQTLRHALRVLKTILLHQN